MVQLRQGSYVSYEAKRSTHVFLREIIANHCCSIRKNLISRLQAILTLELLIRCDHERTSSPRLRNVDVVKKREQEARAMCLLPNHIVGRYRSKVLTMPIFLAERLRCLLMCKVHQKKREREMGSLE